MKNAPKLSIENSHFLFQEWIGVKETDPTYSSITFSRERGLTIQEFVSIVRRHNRGVFPFLL